MNPKLSLLIYRICLYVGIAVILIVALFDTPIGKGAGIAIGAVITLAGAVQVNLFYKCPHCGQYINPRGKQPPKCPKCGKDLNW